MSASDPEGVARGFVRSALPLTSIPPLVRRNERAKNQEREHWKSLHTIVSCPSFQPLTFFPPMEKNVAYEKPAVLPYFHSIFRATINDNFVSPSSFILYNVKYWVLLLLSSEWIQPFRDNMLTSFRINKFEDLKSEKKEMKLLYGLDLMKNYYSYYR